MLVAHIHKAGPEVNFNDFSESSQPHAARRYYGKSIHINDYASMEWLALCT
jgi:hypothetical protein